MPRIFIQILALAGVALMVSMAPTSAAERHVIDRIVALVDDEAIFQSDIDEVIRQYAVQQGKASLSEPERKEMYEQVLKDLVDDKLVIAQASRLGLDVEFSEVEKQVTRAIEDNKRVLGSEDAFQRQLETEGFTMEDLKLLYRRQIRNRMLVERVLQIEMNRKNGEPTDGELQKFYDEHRSEVRQRPAVVNLKTIFVGFDAASTATSTVRAKIGEIHKEIAAGADFAEVAKKYSEDPSAPLGGDLGFVDPKDLREPAFASVVDTLGVGEMSAPVQTTYGWHIVQKVEQREGEGEGEVHIRHILLRLQPDDADIQRAFDKTNTILGMLHAGAAFDSLARQHSTDPNAGPEGDLGWLKVADLPPFFQDVLASMKPGDLSNVLRESVGFRIVKLLGREEERPYEFAEIRGEVKRLYQQQQMADAYQDYVAGLRKKFQVVLK